MRFDVVLKFILQIFKNAVVESLVHSHVVALLTAELPRVVPDLVAELADGRILHLELQSRNEDGMELRMHQYLGPLMKCFPGREIFQVVLYVGNQPMKMKDRFSNAQITYRYELHDIREIDVSVLLQSPLPTDRALALLCAGSDPRPTVKQILASWSELGEQERQSLSDCLVVLSGLRGIEQTVDDEVKEMALTSEFIENNKFFIKAREKGMAAGLAEGQAKGLAEGQAKGLAEGLRRSLCNLLRKRFSEIPTWAADRIAAAAPEQLEIWSLNVLDAKSIDDVFKG